MQILSTVEAFSFFPSDYWEFAQDFFPLQAVGDPAHIKVLTESAGQHGCPQKYMSL